MLVILTAVMYAAVFISNRIDRELPRHRRGPWVTDIEARRAAELSNATFVPAG